MSNGALVVIVDDDESMRESVAALVDQIGYVAQTFASAEAFLVSDAIDHAKCLVLDIGLPGMSGLDLQRELIRRGHSIPTIFITGRAQGSIPPGLLKDTGISCLFKPFSDQEIRAAIDVVLHGI
jgi:FixJ family two-component response regulator